MFRKNIVNDIYELMPDEIFGLSGFIFNIHTGEVKHINNEYIGTIEFSDIPIEIYYSCIPAGFYIRYEDYLELYYISFDKYKKIVNFKNATSKGKVYLGSFISGHSILYSYMSQDSLWIGNRIFIKDFSTICKKFLYITSKKDDRLGFYNDKNVHFINTDGVYLGTPGGRYIRFKDFYIIMDVYLCICNDEYTCIIHINPIQKYTTIVNMIIQDIDIRSDMCQIFTPDCSYVISNRGTIKIDDPELFIKPVFNNTIKSARNI